MKVWLIYYIPAYKRFPENVVVDGEPLIPLLATLWLNKPQHIKALRFGVLSCEN